MMKLTPQFLRSQMRQLCGLERTGPKCNRSVITRTPLAGRWYLTFAALMILICLSNPVSAQSGDVSEYCSTDTPMTIPDNDTAISELTIGQTGEIVDLNVRLTITHDYDGNLDIFLIAPDGTRVELFTDVGKNYPDFDNTILDDEAEQSIADGSAPFAGSYRPEGRLADLVGKDINGLWKLEVTDDWRNEGGTLESWSLIVTFPATEPLPAPAIEIRSGAGNEVSWADLGESTQYEWILDEETFYDGTIAGIIAVKDSGMIEDLNVLVNIRHETDSEIDLYLVAPDGTRIELATGLGGSDAGFVDTLFDDQSLTSITGGAPPFTGQYRPEGALDDLIGEDIHGEWMLEITDHMWETGDKLNSWSLIADVADVLYYVECSAEANFGTVVADSGWTTGRSHVFDGLDPKSRYWYRAKAKPLKTWSQTGMADFQADDLTDTIAARVGEAVLASVDELGPEVDVIPAPSFEISGSQWGGVRTEDNTYIGRVKFLWASDGAWAGCVEFRTTGPSGVGSYAYQHVPVDWTGVDTLIFDYVSYFNAGNLIASVLIGDKEVWSVDIDHNRFEPQYDLKVDVSGFTGYHDLRLRAESKVLDYIDAGIAWDNLRTYGSLGHVTDGSAVSVPISLDENEAWDMLVFEATTPAGTSLTVDVLPESGSTPIDGYENVLGATDMSGLTQRTIRLRANLSTNDPAITPALHYWSVTCTNPSRESDWSNVESALP